MERKLKKNPCEKQGKDQTSGMIKGKVLIKKGTYNTSGKGRRK